MKRKLSILLAVALVFTTLLPGCGKKNDPASSGQSNPDASAKKDTLVMGQYGDAPNLDPHNCLNDNAMRVEVNIYDPLIRMDENFKPVPCVAESWKVSEDGTEYIFHIKQGIKFHNGDELKVSDVVYSINRGVKCPQAGPSYSGVLGAEDIGNNDVKVTLAGPNNQLLAAFSLPMASILDEKVVTEAEANGGKYGRQPVGSGPYKLANWVTGEKIELVAFDDYHDGVANIKNVTFRAIADQAAAVISLEKGEIDTYVDLSTSNFAQVEAADNLTLHTAPAFMYEALAFNCSKPPFDNVKVRQAIAHAVDKDALVNGVCDGYGQIIDTFAMPSMAGYTDDFTKYDYDLEKAKALLTEAGYPDGFDCTIAADLDYVAKFGQVISESLAEIGVNAQVSLLEGAAFKDMVYSGKHDMCFTASTYAGPDMSDTSVYLTFSSSRIDDGRSCMHYRNDEIDQILEEGRKTVDEAKRAPLYTKLIQIVADEVPMVPFIWDYKNIAANKDLKNVYAQPQSMYYVHDYAW